MSRFQDPNNNSMHYTNRFILIKNSFIKFIITIINIFMRTTCQEVKMYIIAKKEEKKANKIRFLLYAWVSCLGSLSSESYFQTF